MTFCKSLEVTRKKDTIEREMIVHGVMLQVIYYSLQLNVL